MMVHICTKFHQNILNGIKKHENLTAGQTARGKDGQMDRQTEGTTQYDLYKHEKEQGINFVFEICLIVVCLLYFPLFPFLHRTSGGVGGENIIIPYLP